MRQRMIILLNILQIYEFIFDISHGYDSDIFSGEIYQLIVYHCVILMAVFFRKIIRIITNEDCIAHSEPICKRLNLLQVTGMFGLTIWKFYYKLINHVLPLCFQIIIPTLPRICDTLPAIQHDYAEQLIEYQLVKILNGENQSILITSKVHTIHFTVLNYT